MIGFPNGYSTTAVKAFETEDALANGAKEIDMVINIGWLKDKRYELIEDEIKKLKSICKDKVLKVIIETCFLTDDEKIRMCDIVTSAGADYIKTSTGFGTAGATFDDIKPVSYTHLFDAKTKDFILYVLDNYGEKYAAKQQMSPIKTELPSDVEFSDLYLRIRDDMDKTGAQFLKPWDTYLDADTNTTMQDNLLLLASGDMSVDDFCKLIDDSIATNAKN